MSKYSSRRPAFQLLSFSPLTWCVVRNTSHSILRTSDTNTKSVFNSNSDNACFKRSCVPTILHTTILITYCVKQSHSDYSPFLKVHFKPVVISVGQEFSQAVCSLLHIMPDSHITYCNILQGNFKQYVVL